MNYNKIKIIGEVREKIDDRNYLIAVKRLSGTEDVIPVRIPDDFPLLGVGLNVEVNGYVRTENKIENERNRLIVYVQTESMTKANSRHFNEVEFSGYLCKSPVYRVTPFNREICDLLVAVNTNDKANYLPCIGWGKNARALKDLFVGDIVTVKGRFQSRDYEKVDGEKTITKTAYEISIN
jgi:primosomal replication protein N